MSNSDQNKIDWDYWLNINGIKDHELILLTMNIDPHNEKSDFFDGTLSLPRVDAQEDLSRVFLNRRRFLSDWRYIPYSYLTAVDGLPFKTFTHGSYNGQINLRRFLVWYIKEGKNWKDIPQEMLEMAEREVEKITTSEAPKEAQKPIKNKNKKYDEAREQDLRLIGAMLEMLKSKVKTNYTQESIANEILEKYPSVEVEGRTIAGRFAEANKSLEELKR